MGRKFAGSSRDLPGLGIAEIEASGISAGGDCDMEKLRLSGGVGKNVCESAVVLIGQTIWTRRLQPFGRTHHFLNFLFGDRTVRFL